MEKIKSKIQFSVKSNGIMIERIFVFDLEEKTTIEAYGFFTLLAEIHESCVEGMNSSRILFNKFLTNKAKNSIFIFDLNEETFNNICIMLKFVFKYLYNKELEFAEWEEIVI